MLFKTSFFNISGGWGSLLGLVLFGWGFLREVLSAKKCHKTDLMVQRLFNAVAGFC